LIVAPYPKANEKLIDPGSQRVMEAVMDIVRSLRNTRAEYKVDIGKSIEATVYTDSLLSEIKARTDIIGRLAKTTLSILPREKRPSKDEKAVVSVLKDAEVVVPLKGMVDIDAEKARLAKEMEVLEREIARLRQRMGDVQFTSKAPAPVIQKEKNRLREYENKVARMKIELQQLG
ncbi:MAG: hypothetical protein ABSF74_03025, partial [Dehalococcoidia bacterium]